MTMTGHANDKRTRILLFGMECAFTAPIAKALMANPNAQVAAIVLPSTESQARTGDVLRIRQIADGGNVPIVELLDRKLLWSNVFRTRLAGFDADLIVVACFPWRVPPAIVSLPHIASLNVHPSFLPEGRGPEPIFWVFRRALDWTGVTLHIIDDGLDTGPIVDQRRVAIPDNATMITLERTLAQTGAELLRDFLIGLSPLANAWYQPDHAVHPAPFPGAADLVVTTAWNGEVAARFINGVSPVYGFIEVLILATGQRLAVAEVLAIEAHAPGGPIVSIQADHASIEFADSRLQCRLRTQRQQLIFGSRA